VCECADKNLCPRRRYFQCEGVVGSAEHKKTVLRPITFSSPSARGVIDSSTSTPSALGDITTDRGVATNSTPIRVKVEEEKRQDEDEKDEEKLFDWFDVRKT
jgi:hypothetical protein